MIRTAVSSDIPTLHKIDHIAQQEPQRQAFITRHVKAHHCYLYKQQSQIIAYAVFDYSFYDQGFISLLYVDANHRQQGVGSEMMSYLEKICQTSKLFTSTNLSNLPMQSLLNKQGYKLSGVLHYLDEGDPELVYVKFS